MAMVPIVGAEAPRLLAQRPIATLLAGAALALLAGVSASSAYASAFARSAPLAAVKAWPANGFASAHAASYLIQAENGGRASTSGLVVPGPVRALAERAIIAEPAAVQGVRNLALLHAGQGEGEQATQLMRLAARLSSRDTAANMWLVEDYLRRGDLAHATALIDTTLRTDDSAGAILLPGLARILSLPGAEPVMREMLSANPPWAHDFWTALLQTPASLEEASALRLALHRRGMPLAAGHDARLIELLVAAQRFDRAFALHAEAGRAVPLPPIDWKLAGGAGLAVSREADSSVSISALGGSGGVVAQRLIALPRGRHVLRIDADAPSGAISARIVCAHMRGEQTLAMSLPNGGSFAQDTDCSHAWLTLELAPAEEDRTIHVAGATLTRIGADR